MRHSPIFTTLLAILCAFACAPDGPQSKTERTLPVFSRKPVSYPLTITNSNGIPVTITTRPTRIASLATACDEVLLTLLSPEEVAGVAATSTNYFSNVKEKAKQVPALLTSDLESVLALAPDVLFVMSFNTSDFYHAVKKHVSNVLFMTEFETIPAIMKNVYTIASVIDKREKGLAILDDMRERLAAIEKKAEGPRKRVLHISFYNPSLVPGSGTSFDEIAYYAHAVNAAAEVGVTGWGTLPAEQLLQLENIDAVVVGGQKSEKNDHLARVISHEIFGKLAAVRNGRIIFIPDNSLTAVSHYIVNAVESLYAGLYETRPTGMASHTREEEKGALACHVPE